MSTKFKIPEKINSFEKIYEKSFWEDTSLLKKFANNKF